MIRVECGDYCFGDIRELERVFERVFYVLSEASGWEARYARWLMNDFIRVYSLDALLKLVTVIYHVPYPVFDLRYKRRTSLLTMLRKVVHGGIKRYWCHAWEMWNLDFHARYIRRVTKVSDDVLLEFSLERPRSGWVARSSGLFWLSSLTGILLENGVLRLNEWKDYVHLNYFRRRFGNNFSYAMLFVWGLPVVWIGRGVALDPAYVSLVKKIVERFGRCFRGSYRDSVSIGN